MPPPPPQISLDNGVTVVALGSGYENIDEPMLDVLRDVVLAAVDKAETPQLVLDLSKTKFFGSAFIEILFRLSEGLKARGGKFVIAGLQPYCAEVLKITHLDQLWPTYPNLTAALGAINPRQPSA